MLGVSWVLFVCASYKYLGGFKKEKELKENLYGLFWNLPPNLPSPTCASVLASSQGNHIAPSLGSARRLRHLYRSSRINRASSYPNGMDPQLLYMSITPLILMALQLRIHPQRQH